MPALGLPSIDAAMASTRLGRFNPAVKLGCAAVVMVALLVRVDLVSATTLLCCELASLVVAQVPFRVLAARAWPLPVAACGVAVANMVASNGPATATAAVSVRLVAIAVPGVVAFASTDAVDLADSLVQQLKVPARFAYGTLAALRLLPLLGDDWGTIRRARRARGIDPGHNPFSMARLWYSAVFSLLVTAVRRATRLAMAMDSRGFASAGARTTARRQVVTAADWALLAGVAMVVCAAEVAGALV